MNKGISVIIPCYYKWEWVDQCLDSVFQQKNVDTQVICVHNNSDAGLLGKLTKLVDQHKITLIDNGRANMGAAYARNCGLERVTKDTVMFLDDDDIIGWNPNQPNVDPYYLEYFYDVLSQDDQLAMVTGDVIAENLGIEGTNFKMYSGLPRKTPVTIGPAISFLDVRNTSCATLYRTSVINNHNLRFKPHMKYREDTEFITQYALAAASTYRHILKPTKWPESNDGLQSYYWYRKHVGSVMGQTGQPSLNKWYYEYQRQKDNLGYRAYLLQAIEEHPLRDRLSESYRAMIIGWKHTQKDIQTDLCNLNADNLVSLYYFMLTCFDEKSDDAVRDKANDYLSFYAPANDNTEKLNGDMARLAAYNKLKSIITLCSSEG